jgi:hypothetical protein
MLPRIPRGEDLNQGLNTLDALAYILYILLALSSPSDYSV